MLDDITIGSATAGSPPPITGAPEPSTWALLASGMTALGIVARRRRA